MTSTGHPAGPPTVLRSLATEISPLRHSADFGPLPALYQPCCSYRAAVRGSLNGILGDDDALSVCYRDMLNNKNSSDLCCPELDADGEDEARGRSRGARRMKLKSSREIWLQPTNIGRQTNGVGMSKGLERVNGT
jgi:hypothetical protein